jgi:hypothetical protein
MIFCQADWLCVRSRLVPFVQRNKTWSYFFFSLSLPLFPFLFSSSSSSSPRFSFSILHHITNRRRQLMNWRRYIVFEFLCIMAGRGQQTRERGKKFELKKKREKRRKKKRTCSVSTSLITIHISLTYVQNLLMIVLDHLLEI